MNSLELTQPITRRNLLRGTAGVAVGLFGISCNSENPTPQTSSPEIVNLPDIEEGFIPAPGYPTAKGFSILLDTNSARDYQQENTPQEEILWQLGPSQRITLTNYGYFQTSDEIEHLETPDGQVVYRMYTETPEEPTRFTVSTSDSATETNFTPRYTHAGTDTGTTQLIIEGYVTPRISEALKVISSFDVLGGAGKIYALGKDQIQGATVIKPASDTRHSINKDLLADANTWKNRSVLLHNTLEFLMANKLSADIPFHTMLDPENVPPEIVLNTAFQNLQNTIFQRRIQNTRHGETIFDSVFRLDTYPSMQNNDYFSETPQTLPSIAATTLFVATDKVLSEEFSKRIGSLSPSIRIREHNFTEKEVAKVIASLTFQAIQQNTNEDIIHDLFPYLGDITKGLNLGLYAYKKFPPSTNPQYDTIGTSSM